MTTTFEAAGVAGAPRAPGTNGKGGDAPAAVASALAEGRALARGFSVVIPAVNEEDSVADVVRRVQGVMNASGAQYEVIVVADGSTDATAERAAEAGATVYRHPQNAGYGAGLKTGIACARFDRIVITDA